MKTNQVMIRPMGQFKVEQRTKDAFFNATALLKQWNEITGSVCTIAEYIEAYIPNSVRDKVVMAHDNVIYLPVSLEPQLRLYAANYNLDLYDELKIDNIDGALTWNICMPNGTTDNVNRTISTQKTYLMIDEACGAVKIGKSSNPQFRERTLGAQMPKIRLIAICPRDIEQILHERYQKKRMRGEWFNLSSKDIRKIVKEYGFDRVQ